MSNLKQYAGSQAHKRIMEIGQRVPPAGESLPKVEIFPLYARRWPRPHPVQRLVRNFGRPGGPTVPSATPNFTWIGATSRPYGAKMLIFDLRVNLNTGWCRFAASCR